jgi:carbonic anhydrase
MTVIDDALRANEQASRTYDSARGRPPSPKLVIVTCMDPRLNDILSMLGLQSGDADVIRNAGDAITEDALRSLLVSTRVLGSREIMIINHTGCGMQTFTDEQLQTRLEQQTGTATIIPERFYAFTDPEANVREQIQKVKGHPWIAKDIPVRGFIFDVDTGRLREVTPVA